MTYKHKRYGDLEKIAAKTSGRCHLCGKEADLLDYGSTRLFGAEATNVDHLLPRAFGGDDDPDNLLLAHAGCNSKRGTREPDEVRLELMGRPWAPMSSFERACLTATGGVVGGAIAGSLFAKKREDGKSEFNAAAALVGGVLTGGLICLLT